jgi:Tat protein secretion system quality control protein TatD with DNase activity
VRLIAEKIAALRGVTLDQVAADTERTAEAFFKL